MFEVSSEEENDEKKPPFYWVVKHFRELVTQNAELAPAVAAVRTLTEVIKVSKAHTMMELEIELKTAVDLLKNSGNVLSVASGCELFTRFVTRTSGDIPDFEECKKKLIERGEQYSRQSATSREKIGNLASSFIRDGVTVLTHGFSRAVLGVLLHAMDSGKIFSVIVTESRPDDAGYQTAKRLHEAKIPVTLIVDSAVGHFMDKIDLVLVGAEGIVENGGIVNKIGTYQISLVASAFKKPFYVAAESFKFMRLYPLTQRDLSLLPKSTQKEFKFCKECSPVDTHLLKDIAVSSVNNDYTPPSYITLLFTELGILTPSAFSDELIKLYY